MELFLEMGAAVFLALWLTGAIYSLVTRQSHFEAGPGFLGIMAAMGFLLAIVFQIVRFSFHSLFVWAVEPIGIVAWLLTLIGIIFAHHNGVNIWLGAACTIWERLVPKRR